VATPLALARAARSAGTPTSFIPAVAAGLGIWLVLTSVLAALGVYTPRPEIGIPGTPIALLAAIVVSAIAIRRIPSLRVILAEPEAQPALIWLQVWRLDGLAVLILWGQGVLPGAFALPAGLGDLAIGFTAPFVARQVHRRNVAAAWNVAGFVILIVSVTLAVTTTPGSLHVFETAPSSIAMTEFPMAIIPTFLVTVSNALHLASLRFLLTRVRAQTDE
jgi:hypothetical protein